MTTQAHISDERGERGGVVVYLISEDGERSPAEVAGDTLGAYIASLEARGIKVS